MKKLLLLLIPLLFGCASADVDELKHQVLLLQKKQISLENEIISMNISESHRVVEKLEYRIRVVDAGLSSEIDELRRELKAAKVELIAQDIEIENLNKKLPLVIPVSKNR